MKFLIIFIYLITTTYCYSIEKPDIDNIVINKIPKTYKEIVFKDLEMKNIDLNDYKGKLLILNFWATWCAPCLEEMPSLDLLQSNRELSNLKIFPINIGQENLSKSVNFFKELDIPLSVTVSKFAEPIPNILVQSWCGIISVYLNLGASRHIFLA